MFTFRTHHRRPGDSGFSFIELLAYMAIAALLILAAIPQFGQYRQKAAISNVQNDLHNAAQAMEAANIGQDGYPSALPAMKTSKGVTLSLKSSGDQALAAYNMLMPNTGMSLTIKLTRWSSPQPNVRFYYGPEGVALVTAIKKDTQNPITDADKARILASPVEVYNIYGPEYAPYWSVQTVFGATADTVTDAAGNSVTYDLAGRSWPDVIGSTPVAAGSYCVTGSSDAAPGQPWHYSSDGTMAAGTC